LAAGANFQTTANSWQTGNFLATSNQVNCLDTIGNIFAVTGVQLEIGSVATPFEHRMIDAELASCQRYYEKSFAYAVAPAQNTGSFVGALYGVGQVVNQPFSAAVIYAVTKRATPTLTAYSPNAATNGTTPTVASNNEGDHGFALSGTTSVTAGNGYSIHWTASAEL
jgi:hypothetical protein